MDTFIFNLNKNQKYKKIKNNGSIRCDSSHGPQTNSFGYFDMQSMRLIDHRAHKINDFYDKGSEILPNDNDEKKDYDLLEAEVYKIIIE